MKVKTKWFGTFKQRRNLRKRGQKSVDFGLRVIARNMRKLMKDRPRGVASPPGTAPFAHRKRRGKKDGGRKRLKDTIVPAMRFGKMSGVVGTAAQWAERLGALHDKGGTQYVYSNWWKRRKARPRKRKSEDSENEDTGKRRQDTKRKIATKSRMIGRLFSGTYHYRSEKESNAIKKWYLRKRGYSGKNIKTLMDGKKTLAKYPKRPFSMVALIMSLKRISSKLAAR